MSFFSFYFGRVICRSPSLNLALIADSSIDAGKETVLKKSPLRNSLRYHSPFFSFCSSQGVVPRIVTSDLSLKHPDPLFYTRQSRFNQYAIVLINYTSLVNILTNQSDGIWRRVFPVSVVRINTFLHQITLEQWHKISLIWNNKWLD